MASDSFTHYLEELSADYRRGLPDKLAELDLLWGSLETGSVPPVRIADLHRELHNIAGTAKTMGLPAVTDAARTAEYFLEPFVSQAAPIDSAAQSTFRQLLDDVKRSADSMHNPP